MNDKHRQKTDDLRGRVERAASVAADILDRTVETAGARKLSALEADTADEAIFSLKRALSDLYKHRESR